MPGPRRMVIDVRAASIPEADSARALLAVAEWARRVRARIDTEHGARLPSAERTDSAEPVASDSGRMAA